MQVTKLAIAPNGRELLVEIDPNFFVAGISFGNDRFDRQINGDRFRLLDRVSETHFFHCRCQHARVEIESDRRDVAALLGSQDVAGATNFEVSQRDLESCAKLGRFLDRFESRDRFLAQSALVVIKQIRVGAVVTAPDSPAQLIKLRESEVMGLVDDDRIDVGDIDAGLDDGGADQDVELVFDEREHDAFELVLVHLSVADSESCLRHQTLQVLQDVVDALHAVVDEVDLTTATELSQDRLSDEPITCRCDERANRRAISWRRVDH